MLDLNNHDKTLARINSLERENARLERENASLRAPKPQPAAEPKPERLVRTKSKPNGGLVIGIVLAIAGALAAVTEDAKDTSPPESEAHYAAPDPTPPDAGVRPQIGDWR